MCDTHFNMNGQTTFRIESKKKISDQQIVSMIVNISSAPSVSSIDSFARSMKDKGVTDIFCFCKLAYDSKVMEKYQIDFHYLEFEDGKYPDDQMIQRFNTLIDQISQRAEKNNSIPNINMHCHAGMGRAPTFLAYLMISRYGWGNVDTIDWIRKWRRGSFNKTQLNWIIDLKPPVKKQCLIM